jgi:iron complex transport system substrate-binding protein
MRVISLLASGTEIVCALGAGDSLVGRSHECDNPEWVKSLPVCSAPAFDVSVSSGQIDAEVRRRLKSGEPLYHIDTDLIRKLKPDLLITQAHCEVCAVTPENVEQAGCDVLAKQVLALTAGSLQGIFEGIAALADALALPQAGVDLTARMQKRMSAITQAVKHRPAPTVVMLEWTDPIFSMGNWAPELVEAANGCVLLGDKGQHSQAIAWERVREADPDYLIIAPCGFDLERTRRELLTLEALPGWSELGAVKSGHTALADGNKFFNRSGITVVETVEIIADILHGSYAPARWEGLAWEHIPAVSKIRPGHLELEAAG